MLRGDPVKGKELKSERIRDLLGIKPQAGDSLDTSKFLLPVLDAELMMTSILEDLLKDPWRPRSDQRPARCTGTALEAAIGLLESTCKGGSARIMIFAGGPPSIGAGKVVGLGLAETIRSHRDCRDGKAPHFDDATKFYTELAVRCVRNGHVVDISACSLDQVGIAEMKVLIEQTGGFLILSDSFMTSQFQESFQKIFERDDEGELDMTFDATIRCVTSREYKICGAIGPMAPLPNEEKSAVSENMIGHGETTLWSLGGLTSHTTASFYFEVVNQQAKDVADGRFGYLQFVTEYRHIRAHIMCV
eukprot:TRINITY_DN1983_c0_g1_i1.p1 TRINITY_DN1983_c0_g1~~TRINITY_DN1983_c0_g1_i1.p1  ORF type:complete len:304 (-),score=67.61 TRINITY_DN1983_c0_g1_i1:205-1116(-)